MSGLLRCFGVLGDPVAHSRSPAMHAAAFATLGLPHRYLPFHVAAAELGSALMGARALGFGGLNLTVPHKVAAVSCMDQLGDEARRIGAVNTVCFEHDRIIGHNTDGRGFVDALRELEGAAPTRALVLGTGGAAMAIVDALSNLGSPLSVTWVGRSAPRTTGVFGIDYEQLSRLDQRFDLLVNATTVGMAGGPSSFPIPIDLGWLDAGSRVIDVVYPRPGGGLLDQARAEGHLVQSGEVMLLWQGVRALEHWLGQPMPAEVVAAMRAALAWS